MSIYAEEQNVTVVKFRGLLPNSRITVFAWDPHEEKYLEEISKEQQVITQSLNIDIPLSAFAFSAWIFVLVEHPDCLPLRAPFLLDLINSNEVQIRQILFSEHGFPFGYLARTNINHKILRLQSVIPESRLLIVGGYEGTELQTIVDQAISSTGFAEVHLPSSHFEDDRLVRMSITHPNYRDEHWMLSAIIGNPDDPGMRITIRQEPRRIGQFIPGDQTAALPIETFTERVNELERRHQEELRRNLLESMEQLPESITTDADGRSHFHTTEEEVDAATRHIQNRAARALSKALANIRSKKKPELEYEEKFTSLKRKIDQ